MTRAQEIGNTLREAIHADQSMSDNSRQLALGTVYMLEHALDMLDSIAHSLERIAVAHKSPTSDPMSGADQSVSL